MAMFICDNGYGERKCNFTTESLNVWLSHRCCAECGYVAVHKDLYYDKGWDMTRHWNEAHPEIIARNREVAIKQINEWAQLGRVDDAKSLQDLWEITDEELNAALDA